MHRLLMLGAGVSSLIRLQFYFSDSNLVKDKYLKNLISEGEDGWVPLDKITTFNRMKTICPGGVAKVVEVLREHDGELLEVNVC